MTSSAAMLGGGVAPFAGGVGTTSPQVKVSQALSELASCACFVGGVALAASKLPLYLISSVITEEV